MLLTDKFVMLHFPKTGSTFARKAIKQAFLNRRANLSYLHKAFIKLGFIDNSIYEVNEHYIDNHTKTRKSEHGGYKEIPVKYKNKAIYSIIRDPYSAFLSRFEFRQRKANAHFLVGDLKEKFPKFPNLNIDEYIEFSKHEEKINFIDKKIYPANVKLGGMSRSIIYLYFKEPNLVFKNLTNNFLQNGDYSGLICDVKFLDQKKLNQELYQMLKHLGFKEADVRFISFEPKTNVTKSKTDNKRESLLNQNVLNYLQEYEALYFRLYKDLGYKISDNDHN